METTKIQIEVAYAKPDKQEILSLQVEKGCTIEKAIYQSGILKHFLEIKLYEQPVGVFSQPRNLEDKVQAGERIEIYRPLLMDPKEARKLRAKKTKSLKSRKNPLPPAGEG